MRVGHAVEHQQQRLGAAGFFELLQQLVERRDLRDGIDAGNNALMAVAAAHFGQAQAVGLDQAHTGFAGAIKELAHAGVAARGVKKNFKDGLGRGFEPHADGMKTEKNFGGRGHAPIIAAGLAATAR